MQLERMSKIPDLQHHAENLEMTIKKLHSWRRCFFVFHTLLLRKCYRITNGPMSREGKAFFFRVFDAVEGQNLFCEVDIVQSTDL